MHYYAHHVPYDSEANLPELFICGGGGAFLHSTWVLSKTIAVSFGADELFYYKLGETFPSPMESCRLSFEMLIFFLSPFLRFGSIILIPLIIVHAYLHCDEFYYGVDPLQIISKKKKEYPHQYLSSVLLFIFLFFGSLKLSGPALALFILYLFLRTTWSHLIPEAIKNKLPFIIYTMLFGQISFFILSSTSLFSLFSLAVSLVLLVATIQYFFASHLSKYTLRRTRRVAKSKNIEEGDITQDNAVGKELLHQLLRNRLSEKCIVRIYVVWKILWEATTDCCVFALLQWLNHFLLGIPFIEGIWHQIPNAHSEAEAAFAFLGSPKFKSFLRIMIDTNQRTLQVVTLGVENVMNKASLETLTYIADAFMEGFYYVDISSWASKFVKVVDYVAMPY